MTAHHPAALLGNGAPALAEILAWQPAQLAPNLRALRCRAECEALDLHPALTAALVARAASPAVVLAAAERFRWWRGSLAALERTVAFIRAERPWQRASCPSDHPTEEHAGSEIVATCIDLERAGLLERPCAEPRAGGAR